MTAFRDQRTFLQPVETPEKALAEHRAAHPGDEMYAMVVLTKGGWSRIWLSQAVMTAEDYQFASDVIAGASGTVLEMQFGELAGSA